MNENKNNLTDKDKPETKPEEKKSSGLLSGKIFTKIKTIKHIEIIILVAFAAVLLLIVFGFSGSSGTASNGNTDLETYQKNMEKQLSEVISKINGAGKSNVMITFETGAEQVLAYSTDKQTNSSTDSSGKLTSSVVERSQLVLISGKPVVLYEIQPKVKGVLIVAEGADNVKVKIEIMQAVSTILKIDAKYIEIFSMVK